MHLNLTKYLTLYLAAALFVVTPVFAQSNDSASTDLEIETLNDSGSANPVESKKVEKPRQSPEASLNDLFQSLKRQTKLSAARATESKIWAIWTNSENKTINALMDWSFQAMGDKRFNIAEDMLDQVIELEPGYAEGWNRRATMFYQKREFGKSLSDIEQTLRLEPRHFGALSGLGTILQNLNQDEKALETWYKVLEIYPASIAAQKAVISLEEELAGERT